MSRTYRFSANAVKLTYVWNIKIWSLRVFRLQLMTAIDPWALQVVRHESTQVGILKQSNVYVIDLYMNPFE